MVKKPAYKRKPMFVYDFASLYPNVTNPTMTDEWQARLRSIMRNRLIEEVLADLELPENEHYTHGHGY